MYRCLRHLAVRTLAACAPAERIHGGMSSPRYRPGWT